MSERVQKFLARAGAAPSRRKAEDLVREGRVSVGGRPARLGDRIEPGDEVRLDGRVVRARAAHVTYALHKPAGVLSSASDDRGRPTVMDLVPAAPGLHPVGRLDLDSEGLILLSTDGELTLRLTHPRYGHEKEYRLWTEPGDVPDRILARLEAGVELDDGPARALRARRAPGGCVLVLAEGRNRQARRMMDAVGRPVVRLLRTRVGGLRLGDLEPGAWRELGDEDLEALGYTPA